MTLPKQNTNKISYKNTYILTTIFIVCFAISFLYTITLEYVPTSKEDVTAANSDIYAIVTKEEDILLPVSSYFDTRTSRMDLDIYFKNPDLTPNNFRKIILSENNSSLLTVNDILNTKGKNFTNYNLSLLVRHPLVVTNQTEKYTLDIFYRLANETTGDLKKLSIPVQWNVRSLDFSPINYFWIIFSGVLLSRVLVFRL